MLPLGVRPGRVTVRGMLLVERLLGLVTVVSRVLPVPPLAAPIALVVAPVVLPVVAPVAVPVVVLVVLLLLCACAETAKFPNAKKNVKVETIASCS